MRDPFEVDPNDGKVTIYEKASGKPRKVWPVDAREILATSDYYTHELPSRVKEQIRRDGGDPEKGTNAPDPDKEHLVGITGGNTPTPPDQSSKGTAAVREVAKSAVAGETENPFGGKSLVRQALEQRAERDEKKTGEPRDMGDKMAPKRDDSNRSASSSSSNVNKDGVTREDLDKMSKAELVTTAEKHRVQISATTMTSQQIKDEVAKKLGL